MPKLGEFAQPPPRVGRLTVIGFHDRDQKRHARFMCRCDCGTLKAITGYHLRKRAVLSCGCILREMLVARNKSKARPEVHTPTYGIWRAMIGRCADPRRKYYGARGIKVCARWRAFKNFLTDMGERPSAAHTIDRIDSSGHYSPENCRWATKREQANNRRPCSCPHCEYHLSLYASQVSASAP